MTRDQVFWAICGLICAVLVGVYVIWGGKVRADLEGQRQAWEEHRKKLERLETLAKVRKIPNAESIEDWFKFKDWGSSQTQEVVEFFRQRDNVLERKLIEGSQEPEPGDFKSAYNDLYRESCTIVRKQAGRGIKVPGVESLFTRYPWMATATLPKPSEYRAIRKDLSIRRYFILKLLLTHRVQSLQAFRVMPPEVIPVPNAKDSEFNAIPVRVRCALPAGEVVRLLTNMLRVREGDSDKLFVIMRELSMAKGAGPGGSVSAPLTMEFLVDVVDFEPKG